MVCNHEQGPPQGGTANRAPGDVCLERVCARHSARHTVGLAASDGASATATAQRGHPELGPPVQALLHVGISTATLREPRQSYESEPTDRPHLACRNVTAISVNTAYKEERGEGAVMVMGARPGGRATPRISCLPACALALGNPFCSNTHSMRAHWPGVRAWQP